MAVRPTGMFGMVITVGGEVQTIKMIEGLDRSFRKFKPFFNVARVSLRRYFNRQFAGEGVGPRVGKWKKLSEPYATRKRVIYGRKKIMQRKGDLRKSFIAARGGGDAIRLMTDDQFVYGSSMPYAAAADARRKIIDLDSRFDKDLGINLEWHVRKAIIRERRKRGPF